MAFNSFNFLIFFPVFFAIYFLLSHKFRWIFLLIGSIVFYSFFSVYGLILFAAVILFNYFSGIAIEKSPDNKLPLFVALIFNIGWLVLFKYFNFFNSNLTELLSYIGVNNPLPFLNWILPAGISYYIFQAIGYNVDISNELQPAEKHLGKFATCFLFFPKVALGPVERPRNLLPQINQQHDFNYDRITSGLKLFAWGLFKKVVIADRLSILVAHVYSDTTSYSGFILILTAVFYTFQLYADFSGYTDMALGIAEALGFKLMKNFNRPFASTSITEFWQRWHISFSTWLYEYLYNPISLIKRSWGKWGMVYAIMITFTLCGLWHGVGWVFLVWGIINGMILSYEVLTIKFRKNLSKKINPHLFKILCWIITFSVLCLSSAFSHCKSLSEGIYFVTHVFNIPSGNSHIFKLGLDPLNYMIIIAAVIVMESVQYFQSKGSVRQLINSKHWVIRWSLYFGILIVILFFGEYDNRQFIYFQF
ncbi:MAG: MBOAT family O-acyltransferase [Bacteroidia bacterium]